MSVIVSNVIAGANSYQTPPQSVGVNTEEGIHPGVVSGFNVAAQASPNATVKVGSGVAIVRATPTSESERLFRVTLSADTNVTIAANSSGSTKYDIVYIVLPAATLHAPPADGDFTEAATILTERHNAAGEALTASNGLALAEVTVANGFTTIANSVINNYPLFAFDGWVETKDVFTFVSVDGATFTANTPGNKVWKYKAGYRHRATQTTTTWKYFIQQKDATYDSSTNLTTVTLDGGTSYTLASGTLSNHYFSTARFPTGFPSDPEVWAITATDTTQRTQSTPSGSTWYNINAAHQIVMRIGTWKVRYESTVFGSSTSATFVNARATLSTANNSATDATMTAVVGQDNASAATGVLGTLTRSRYLTVTSKTTYYLNHLVAASGGTLALNAENAIGTLIIKAENALL